jgi:hypothetical protein
LRNSKTPPVWRGQAGKAEFLRYLGLGDFAALDAVGADAEALAGTVDEGVDGLEIGIPATPGYVVRVRDVVAEARAFAANVANLCHDEDSKLF